MELSYARLVLYAMALVAGLTGGLGDILLYKWAKGAGELKYIVSGFVCWAIALVFFAMMLKKGLLADCVILFLLANCAIALIAGPIIFHDPMSRQKWLGVALAITALVLIETG